MRLQNDFQAEKWPENCRQAGRTILWFYSTVSLQLLGDLQVKNRHTVHIITNYNLQSSSSSQFTVQFDSIGSSVCQLLLFSVCLTRGVHYITFSYPFFTVIYLKLVHSIPTKKKKRFAQQNTNLCFAEQVFKQFD